MEARKKMKSKITFLTLALVVFSFGLSFGQAVSLEAVSGLNQDDEIIPGENVTFYIRLTNRDIQQDVISNGFRVYSPDGVVWEPMDATENPATLNPAYAWDLSFGFPCMFDLGFFVNYFSTGTDSDTIGFGGAVGQYGTGLSPLWNDTCVLVQYWCDQ